MSSQYGAPPKPPSSSYGAPGIPQGGSSGYGGAPPPAPSGGKPAPGGGGQEGSEVSWKFFIGNFILVELFYSIAQEKNIMFF